MGFVGDIDERAGRSRAVGYGFDRALVRRFQRAVRDGGVQQIDLGRCGLFSHRGRWPVECRNDAQGIEKIGEADLQHRVGPESFQRSGIRRGGLIIPRAGIDDERAAGRFNSFAVIQRQQSPAIAVADRARAFDR